MLILNGATCLCLGGLGTRLGVESSTRDENHILMFVDGNLRTHLQNRPEAFLTVQQWKFFFIPLKLQYGNDEQYCEPN